MCGSDFVVAVVINEFLSGDGAMQELLDAKASVRTFKNKKSRHD
jgi:hypothetical protein